MISFARQTMKHSSLVLVVAVAAMTVACGANSPIGPEAISRSTSTVLADLPSTGALSGTITRQALFPPIDPPGISCPSDAPQIRVGSMGSRLDIEFSEIKGTIAYEIEIRDSAGGVAALLHVDAPAHYGEWRGPDGAYLVRVRSRNCGGFGNWSESAYQQIHGERAPAVPKAPDCTPEVETAQESFTFWPGGDLQDGDVTITLNNGDGIWGLALFSSPDDLASDTEAERSTSGTFGVSSTGRVNCGQTGSLSVHEENHPYKYWWYRIYLDGVLYYTSGRYSL
jgi:hypothetical protein